MSLRPIPSAQGGENRGRRRKQQSGTDWVVGEMEKFKKEGGDGRSEWGKALPAFFSSTLRSGSSIPVLLGSPSSPECRLPARLARVLMGDGWGDIRYSCGVWIHLAQFPVYAALGMGN